MMGSTELRAAGTVVVATVMFLSAACSGGGLPDAAEVTGAVVVDSGEADPRVRAMLAQECVEHGGEQSLTVRVDDALSVRYLSTYADGESGRPPPHGGGYGGEGSMGVEPEEEGAKEEVGTQTWSVAEDAPPGIVVVYVTALLSGFRGVSPDDAFTRLMVSFRLVGPGEECPWAPSEAPALVTDTGAEHPGVRATLEHECVRPGDRQVLSVELERSASVSYLSVYANGENGRPSPNGGGYEGVGVGVVRAGAPGELGWTIEGDAPPGVVTVHVRVSGPEEEEPVHQTLTFLLADPEEGCP